jgi:hypothetical protein
MKTSEQAFRVAYSFLKNKNATAKEAAADKYQIIDTKTKQPVGSDYQGSQRSRASARAEKLNQEYGAVRYIVKPIFSDSNTLKEAMDFTSISSLITPDKKLTDSEIARALRLSIAAELDASHLYELIADSVEDKQVQDTLRDISREEKIHVGELSVLLGKFDKEFDDSIEEGRKEVKDKPDENKSEEDK